MSQSQSPPKSPPRQPSSAHLPGDIHMWVMVLGDLIVFGGYFIIFMVYRSMNPEQFLRAQQHLDVNIGVLNTVILLTSSWFVARSVLACRTERHDQAVRFVWAGGICGLLFIAFKSYEWFSKVTAGHTNSETFYSFYYVLTGVHLVHVIIGLVVLGVMVRELRNTGRRRTTLIESGAVYWHMVDLLWVVIFGLLYVMR
ncbi:cytochrome C oxidase subunit III [Mycobacterium sp. 852013-51886_SCH5428379]|uniref:cytochrome c oxidase subunit 3 family protein n=1 Tax=Mycobacterium sp. 852013-51886_SCH5428379 TaxID=1834111 RepID=UPI0007FF89CD|nr:cytochrome c oxidase subunit 3 family protein [Mycobacterium sp. 852013-51886_SCH5428379]OBB56655.1 cytochrome C oxidase subunit III [Mycobacterium sp. 852013-51886_SCH5428379]